MTKGDLDYNYKAYLESNEPLVFNDLLKVPNVLSFEGVDGEISETFLFTLVVLLVFLITVFKSLETEDVEPGTNGGAKSEHQPALQDDEEPCPICYERILFPVTTNCRHLFCGQCMLVLLKTAHLENIVCPLCRLKIQNIQPGFPERQPFLICRTPKDELIREIKDYNVWFSETSFLRYIKRCPTFVRRLRRTLSSFDYFELIFYNRTLYLRLCLLALNVSVQCILNISNGELVSFAVIMSYVIKTIIATALVGVLQLEMLRIIRRFRQRN